MRCLVVAENIDVKVVTETLTYTVNNHSYLNRAERFNFFCFFLDHIDGRSSLVLLNAAIWLHPVEISPNDTYMEYLCVKVNTSEYKVNISVTYRPLRQTQ